jgi:nicotinate phosphoribosyltransferase
MGVSADSPYTDMAYKLVQFDGRPVLKLSTGKKTLVAEKQVFRKQANGQLNKDIIALRHENIEGEPLLKPVMEVGKRVQPPESLDVIRDRFTREFAMLDDTFEAIKDPKIYLVEISPKLEKLQEKVIHKVIEKELGES